MVARDTSRLIDVTCVLKSEHRVAGRGDAGQLICVVILPGAQENLVAPCSGPERRAEYSLTLD